MDLRQDDRVSVNLAPFIGSLRRSRDSIPCRVIAVDDGQFEVCPEAPFRRFSLRVAEGWIDATLPREKATPR